MRHLKQGLLLLMVAVGAANCRSPAQEAPTVSAAKPQTESQLPGPPGDFRRVFAEVANKTIPSVVSIVSERSVAAPQSPFDFFGGVDPFEFFFDRPGGDRFGEPPDGGRPRPPPSEKFRQSGLGSGFVASADGYIVTNNHVVEGAESLEVELMDEQVYDAELVGSDKLTDLAVIKLKEKPQAPLVPLRFGDSEALEIGEWVVAVGAPFGLNETVTSGIISAKGRQDTGISAYGRFLQTDAAINPGNSGGPLMNLNGEVVGINTAIYSRTGGYQGIGFAIPADLAKNVMDQLIQHGKVTRGWLGVSIQSISPDMAEALGLPSRKGALVSDVLPDGPAREAGIQRGDVIVAVGDEAVNDANDLMNSIASLAPGTKTQLEVLRDGKKQTIDVKIDKRTEAAVGSGEGRPGPGGAGADVSKFGLGIAELSPALRQRYRIDAEVKQGAVVTEVAPSSIAGRAGLEEGDVIVEANRKPVTTAAALAQVLREAPSDKPVLLLVQRADNSFFAALAPKASAAK